MTDYEQIKDIIQFVKKIATVMKTRIIGKEDIKNLQDTVEDINEILYHARRLKFQGDYDLEKEDDYFRYSGEVLAITDLWEQSMQRRSKNKNDEEFWEIYEWFKYVDVNDIYRTVVQRFRELPEGLRIDFLALPYRYTFLKNKIDFTENDFSLIAQHIEFLADSVEKYKWLHGHLADDKSRKILNGIIHFWFEFDLNSLNSLCETERDESVEIMEPEKLLEAQMRISSDKPKVRIPVYIKPEDIFEIPLLMYSIREDYRFYIHFYGQDCLWPCDYELLAV